MAGIPAVAVATQGFDETHLPVLSGCGACRCKGRGAAAIRIAAR
jgi:hypothetical protein